MALTILEAAKQIANPLAQGVVEIIAAENPILERMPIIDIQGTAYRYNREGTLPGIGFRGLNEGFDESTAVLNPQVESLTILGGDMDFDRALIAMGAGSPDIRAANDAQKLKAASLKWLKTFFDGDSEANPREFDGLNVRLGSGSQVIPNATNGGPLDLDKLDEMIDAVVGTPDVLLMSKRMQRILSKTVRAADQALETITDAFGRPLSAYSGVPIAIVEDDNEGNAILAFDEADGAGNFDTGSIYALRLGLPFLHGIQTAPIDARDLGEVSDKPVLRTRVEWYSGVVLKHPKAAARLTLVNDQ